MRPLILLACLVAVVRPAGAADQPRLTTLTPPTAVRGSEIQFGTADAADKEPLWLWLKPLDSPPVNRSAPGSPRQKADDPFGPFPVTAVKSEPGQPRPPWSAVVPADLPLGRYLAGLSKDKGRPDGVLFAAAISVTRGTNLKPVLSAVHPATAYPRDHTYVLLGDHFSEVPEDHVLIVDGRDIIRLTPGDPPPAGEESSVAAGIKVHGPQKIEVFGRDLARLDGRVKVRVRIGDEVSDAAPVTIAGVGRWVPTLLAAAVTLALAGLVYLVARRVGQMWIAGREYGPIQALLLDKETETYSLSKFQLYAWTAAAVFGYVFLTVSWSLVQSRPELPPIPENLAGLLAISLGTTAAATGITSARGPKGAGDLHPSVADLITTGGVVTGERFQFFVWTCLGVLGFLFLVVRADPGGITDLPKIPETFLYLMGVSSAGYLGGKLARKAGPVIDNVTAQLGSPLTIDVRGRRLARRATFQIDGANVVPALVGPGVGTAETQGTQPDATVQVVSPDAEAQDPEFAAVLRLTVTDLAAWATRNGLTARAFTPAATPGPAAGGGPVNPGANPASGNAAANPGSNPAPPEGPPRPPANPVAAPPGGAVPPADPPPPVVAGPSMPGKHRLTITNPDGQKAVAEFEVQGKR